MSESIRSAAGNVLEELSRSLGTFVGLVWMCFVVVIAVRAADASIHTVSAYSGLLWIVVLLLALVATEWLAAGGYDRLRVDPGGGWTFVWLAAFYLPLAFVPLRFAVWFVAPDAPLLDALFVLATTVAAGWLAFYDGLERLRLSQDDFLHVLGYAVVLGAIPVGAVVLFDVIRLTAAPVGATVAIGVQVAACWVALRGRVP